MVLLTRILLVAAGGAIGAVGRYLLSGWVSRATQSSPFPYGTLSVNVLGALLLGLLLGATTSGSVLLAPRYRTMLGVGLLGAFTTFSTFAYETLESVRVGDLRTALLNLGVSMTVGLAACWLGLSIGERL